MIKNIPGLRELFLSIGLCISLPAMAQQNAQGQKIDALLNMITYAYVDTVDQKKITDDAIRALLKELDPHSTYIPAEELKETNEPLVGKFEGVGIQFNILEDTIMVTQTISGGPSEKLGIRSGDRIVLINDTLVAGIGIKKNDVLKKLRGDKGTKVKVSIARRNVSELMVFNITRDKIPLFSVEASYPAAPGVGYIKISRFADSTVDEFREALKKLKEQDNVHSLVLDLSGNGGGYLNRAIELADEFLSMGKRIVYTEGRNNPKQESYSTNAGGWEKGRLIVLVDENSASASEIVSGAVQDWDRGLVIGRRTFASGLVQNPYPLPDGSAVRLTIARYYTPSGRLIQRPWDGTFDEYLTYTMKDQSERTTSPDQLKYTASGRKVYSGGGVDPDERVDGPTEGFNPTRFGRSLFNRGLFASFAEPYFYENDTRPGSKSSSFKYVTRGFEVDDAMVAAFRAFVVSRNTIIDEESWSKDLPFIRAMIRFEIDQAVFDIATARQRLIQADPQAGYALGRFGEAERLLTLSQGRSGRIGQ